MPALPQVNVVDVARYRMTRQLSRTQVALLVERYRSGNSTYDLAKHFGTDRHTIARHLRREGVPLRPQIKMTPQLINQAKQLYADGRSLAAIGEQFSVSPTTVGTVLKKAGVKVRDMHGRST